MCFSAQASFAAAGFLSITSLLSIRRVIAHKEQKLFYFSLTPLFFAIQQASEGFVWLSLINGQAYPLQWLSPYIFLFFAGTFWPLWIPLSLYKAEPFANKQKILRYFVYAGIGIGTLLFYYWTAQTPGPVIREHHLTYPVEHYPFGITNQSWASVITYIFFIWYGSVTIIPFFISSVRYMYLVGLTVGIGAFVSYIFYLIAFPSVWCFFAAIASILTYCVIAGNTKK